MQELKGFTYLPTQLSQYLIGFRAEEHKRLSELYKLNEQTGKDRQYIVNNIHQMIEDGVNLRTEIVKKDPLKYFVPTGDNYNIIEAVAHCKDNNVFTATIGNFAGNGTGKTETLVNIVSNILMPAYNEYWFGRFDFYKDPKFLNPTIWYCSTAEALASGETVETTFSKYLSPLGYGSNNYIMHKNGRLNKIKLPTSDISVNFKTYFQDKISFESGNVSMIIFDEPPPAQIWEACTSRVRGGVIYLLSFTPLECPPFIIDDIKKRAEAGKPGYFIFTSDLYGTQIGKGIRGWHTKREIDAIVDTYSAENMDARLSGKPMYYTGLIYKNLLKDKHLIDITEEDFERYRDGEDIWYMPHKDAVFCYAEDPADAKPQAGLWFAINPNGRIIFMEEVPKFFNLPYWSLKKGVSYDRHFEDMRAVENEIALKLGMETSLPVKRRILDKYFGNQQRGGQESLIQIYRNKSKTYNLCGKWVDSYKTSSSQSEIEYGHGIVRNMLDDFDKDGAKLIIWSTCQNLWQSLTNYSFKIRLTEGTSFGKKIVELNKDFSDVARYSVCDKANIGRQGKPTVVTTSHKRKFKKDWIKKVSAI